MILSEEKLLLKWPSVGWNINEFPNAYDYYSNLITLPLHTSLTDEDVQYVVENFKNIVGEYI